MTNTEIFSKVQSIIAEQLDQPVEAVQLATNFKNDLDADSLDVFEIINEIEDAFDITIDTCRHALYTNPISSKSGK